SQLQAWRRPTPRITGVKQKPPYSKYWQRSANSTHPFQLLPETMSEYLRPLADHSVSGSLKTAKRLDSNIPTARCRPGRMHFFKTPCRASKSTNLKLLLSLSAACFLRITLGTG